MIDIIGQRKIQKRLSELIDNNKFPRFMVLVGASGSGKRLLCDAISYRLAVYRVVCPDIKIDTIRDIIDQAYKTNWTTLYIIPNADKMSVAARNVLLKVTEEPPNKAYFIMTVENLSNVLPTIVSRAHIEYMDLYTPEDINTYCVRQNLIMNEVERSIALDLCETPGDVEKLCKYNITEFYDFVNLVVDNIAVVSGSNAFKIGGKLAFKDTDDGYDLQLFLRAFRSVCVHRMHDRDNDLIYYVDGVKVTSRYLRDFIITGISKQLLFDNWLLEVRGVWM